jgi:hypothetical protein
MCNEEANNLTDVKIGPNLTEGNSTNIDNFDLPQEITKIYGEHQSLEEYNNTCAYEHLFESFSEKKLNDTIRRENCVPNFKTLQLILEAGWFNLVEHLVQNVYLPKLIDPTHIIYTFLKKFETQTNKLKHLLPDSSKYETLPASYSFDNFDNSIKITLPLPDASFVVEYLTVYCYKDLLKISAIFKARHKYYKFNDSKKLFDLVGGECEHNYNSFNHKLEITFDKLNKLKKWTSLFK